MSFVSSLKQKIKNNSRFGGVKRAPSADGGEGAAKRGRRGGSRFIAAALFIFGLSVGGLLSFLIAGALLNARLSSDKATALRAASRAPSFANAGANVGLDAFTDANPFKAETRDKKDDKKKAESLGSLTLHGTLPDIGAWISDPDGTKLVLKGQDLSGYTLEEVRYAEVVLSNASGSHKLYLVLSGGEAGAKKMPNPGSSKRAVAEQPKNPPKQRLDFSGLEPATETQEGVVPREIVDALMMNPYDELAKLRMTPADDGSGMRMERVGNDSIFSKVGVKNGDVIQAVNGVNITNMADATNALNSLMAGSRFDVTVRRGDKPIDLKYQVR